jgi:DedD protein
MDNRKIVFCVTIYFVLHGSNKALELQMDRALQERIIGAVVLLGFSILVVPVFLDGPSNDTEIVTKSVLLPGQNNQTRKSQTIILERDRTEPVPVSINISGANIKSATTDAKKEQLLPEKHQRSETTKNQLKFVNNLIQTPAISPTNMWAVQLGSFSDSERANNLAADLRKKGFAAFLRKLQTESGSLHRVRVGPQKNRDSAEAIAAKLNSAGHNAQVVTYP